MDLRPGYKQTEIGVLPEDWEVTPLGDIADISSGGTPARKIAEYWNGNIPWVTTAQVDGNIIDGANEFISELGLSRSAARLLPPKTLLIAMYGQGKTRGKTAMLGIEATTNQACAAIQLKPSVNSDFVFRYLVERYDYIRSLSNSGNQENLSLKLVASIKTVLPPLSEQEEISAALSDIDSSLAILARLVAKKRDVRTGVMHRLLAGGTRLAGFSTPWQKKRLGDLGVFLKGAGVKRDDALSGHLPCVRYGEIYTTHHNVIRNFSSYISQDVADGAKRIQFGDLLFAGSGETKAEIGKCVALAQDVEAYAGGDIIILRPKSGNPVFLGWLLNTPQVVRQKANFGQGDAVVHISASALASIEVSLPDLDEQDAIAKVITDMDAEITALEARLEKTRALKQGMMQALLTGRVRLPVQGEALDALEVAHA